MENLEPLSPPGYSLNRFHETSAKFQRYKVLLRRRWWFLLLTAAIAICIQALRINGKATEYISTGQVVAGMQIKLGDKGAVFENRFLEDFYGTQIDTLTSGKLRSRAKELVHGRHPELKPIEPEVRVTQTKGSSILTVTAVGEERNYTQYFLEALLDEYMSLRKEMITNAATPQLYTVLEELRNRDKKVETAKANYEEFLKNNDLTLFNSSLNRDADFLAKLKNSLSVLETEKSFMEKLGQETYLRQKSQNGIGPAAVDTQIAKGTGETPTVDIGSSVGLFAGGISRIEADFLESQSQLRSLEAERERLLRSKYLPEHPAIKELDNKIDAQKTRITTLTTQAEKEWENRRTVLDQKIETYKEQIAIWEVKAKESNEKIVTAQALKSEYDRALQDHEDWKKKLDQLNNLGIEIGEPVSILQRATEAVQHDPELWGPLALALVIGLVAGGVILLLFDRLDDRMNSFSEFQALFPNESILGQIPEQSSRGDVALLRPNDDRHLYAESFRNLRSSILFKNWRGGKPPKIILVTSAVPNEGKTTTVANMAVTMALGGSRVLLVDADLRRGGMNELFKLPGHPGLSDVLTSKVAWRAAVKDSATKGLHVIPRGEALDQTSEVFLSPLATEIVKEMAAEYDYVIFDSAPVLVADDTASLAPKVDTVLFVVRMSSTMARLSAKALDLLYERQVNVGGVILNRSSTNLKEYTYYNYASYYSAGDKGKVAAAEA